MDDSEFRQAVRLELDAMIHEGLVEALPGDMYRLTAAGRAYTRGRGLHRGPTQAAAQATPVSGQKGLVHIECVDDCAVAVPPGALRDGADR